MKPPVLFQVLPDSLKTSLFYRRYNPVPERWYDLFKDAHLKFAPGVTMSLLPTDVLHGQIAFTGFYELPLTRRVVEIARRGGIMIDVGANVGYFSLLWASANSRNKCIAFEASPRNVTMITENIRRNNLEDQITLYPLAAGKTAGTLEFELGTPEQTGWGGFASSKTAASISVDVVRVDEIVTGSEPIELLKVDVEGADTWVLMGCERLLKAKLIKEVHFEQNKERLRTLGIGDDEAVKFLESVGYKVTPQSDPKGNLVDWSATPK